MKGFSDTSDFEFRDCLLTMEQRFRLFTSRKLDIFSF